MGTTRQTIPQSVTVEYTVTGSLDGTTPAPLVELDQADTDATTFDRASQIYRPDPVVDLGLIDPDFAIGGSIGPRCIPFVTIDAPGLVGAPGAALDLVAIRLGTPADAVFQRQIRDLAASAAPIYVDEGFNVAQGSDIRLSGFSAPPGDPIRVRITALVPDSCADLAAFSPPIPPLPPMGPASGDLGAPGGAPTPASGAYPNPAVVGIQGRRVDPAAPLFQQALIWNGLAWAPAFAAVSQLYFGAEVLPAVGPFFLPPGFDLSGAALPATEIPVKATQNQFLRFLHIQQTPGTSIDGTGLVTYTVFVGGVATALSVTLPVTGTDANNVVALPFASSNANISVRGSYAGTITTAPSRVTTNVQGVAA